MAVELSALSRFVSTEPVIKDGKETFGMWVDPIGFNNLDESELIAIVIDQKYAGRPDLIAADIYGTPSLEWVIIMYSRPLNPLGWPPPGVTIKIPSRMAITRRRK